MVTAGIVSRLVSVPASPPLTHLLSPQWQLASPRRKPSSSQLPAAPSASQSDSPSGAAAAVGFQGPEGNGSGHGSAGSRGVQSGVRRAAECSSAENAAESQAGGHSAHHRAVAVMLQSTAAVFGGQSGGVMVDAEGCMLGLVTRWVGE